MVETPQYPTAATRQRLDKWLFFTRLCKSRSGAQKMIESGDVRVNDVHITAAAHILKPGDTVVLSYDRRQMIVSVVAGGQRRGPYEEARHLYRDLTPPVVAGEIKTAFEQATRTRGSGRPTKKERREVDRLQPRLTWDD